MKNPSFLDDTPSLSYEKALAWLGDETMRFAEVLRSPDLGEIVTSFKHHPATDGHDAGVTFKPPTSIKKADVIDVNHRSAWLWHVLAYSQVAVYCEMFRDCSVNLEQLNVENARELAESILLQFRQTHGSDISELLSARLQLVDAVRVIQLLRASGFFTRATNKINQLSLGASSGSRDILGTHAECWIDQEAVTPLFSNAVASGVVTLHSVARPVNHAILLDCAQSIKKWYQEINSTQDDELWGRNVTAINKDIADGLQEISLAQTQGRWEPRNLVLAYRIDHRMLPDVAGFFQELGIVIADTADIIVTIGAGNSPQEFKGRTDKIKELADYLKGKGLTPKRFKLYTGDTPDVQRFNPLFGQLEITSYEILHCRLKRKKLLAR